MSRREMALDAAHDRIDELERELLDLRERSLEVFQAMADAVRGNRQFKPNPRTERFIGDQLERLMSWEEINSVLQAKAFRNQAAAYGKSLRMVFSEELVDPKDLESKDHEQVMDLAMAERDKHRAEIDRLSAEVEELKRKLEVAEGERDITLKHYISVMDKRFGVETED